jgi:ADP-heptose:LPS heptosyltransferase
LTKVLIIRFSSIGDIVLTSPVVRNLKNQMYGGVEIHYLTKDRFSAIVEAHPQITKVFSIAKSTNEIIDQLKAERYDYIIDLHRNLRSGRVKSHLRMLSFTVEKLNWKKWLWVNLGINRMPNRHIVDRYMDCVAAFKIENDNKGLDFFIPEGEHFESGSIPETHHENFICLGIGAAHWRKKPREEQYLEICRRIQKTIILLGGPSEKDLGERIAKKSGGHVWNAAGNFSLGGTAHLVNRCSLIITPDTGIMHIAAAFKKPIISLWGATVPGFGMYPYQNENLNMMVQAGHLKKRPCSKLGTRCQYKKCRCIDELPLDDVVRQVNDRFNRTPS